jgi:DegV family protein with EDD domain
MSATIRLVIDSGSQTCSTLVEQYDAIVVPLTVVLDGQPFLEGVDLTHAAFYERLAASCEVTTAAPGPGQFLAAYQAAADAGATGVLSIHLASGISGTVNSARIAAGMSPIPVEVLDTDASGWELDALVAAAGEALRAGADVSGAVAAACTVRDRVINVFMIGQPELLERGGRSGVVGGAVTGVSLLASRGDDVFELGNVDSTAAFIETTVRFITEETSGKPIRLAVGDAHSPDIANSLCDALTEATRAVDAVRYEIGPSLAAHLGLGSIVATCFTVA